MSFTNGVKSQWHAETRLFCADANWRRQELVLSGKAPASSSMHEPVFPQQFAAGLNSILWSLTMNC